MAAAPLSDDDRTASVGQVSRLAESMEATTERFVASRRRPSTAHLKDVPPTKSLREELRQSCRQIVTGLDKRLPLTKDAMERAARGLLKTKGLSEGYLGWAMVAVATAFWEDQVAATPPARRLFLLPQRLKHAEGCPADYDQFGVGCEKCGACSIAEFRTDAERLGYKVLVAEGSPIVMEIIVSGHVDAIIGVASLNVLEKAIDKILLAGIPCMAVPLLSSDGRNTSVDEDWVSEMIRSDQASAASRTRSYVHLMRQAAQMFQPATLTTLIPPVRGSVPTAAEFRDARHSRLDPLAATEAIAYEFLMKGGKHSRPFITLAVYDALTGGHGTLPGGAVHLDQLPPAIKRAAASIETFHKASLVHDDIEDNDQFRYGDPSVHRQYGVPTAINVGDYLIGMGYRLISREIESLGAEVVADSLNALADAHLKLAEGQGAELVWRDGRDKRLSPLDALTIYALKTSPAFEAALFVGWRLADADPALVGPLKRFAKNVGVAFQILNDLKDWEEGGDNKMAAGGDVLGGRPTLLLALALATLDPGSQTDLLSLIDTDDRPAAERIRRVRLLYREADVFEMALRLVDKHQQRAEAVADDVANDELRRLLHYLCDTILRRSQDSSAVSLVTPTWLASPVEPRPPTPAAEDV